MRIYVGLAVASLAWAQQVQVRSVEPFSAPGVSQPDRKIAPDDRLSIVVRDEPGLSRPDVRVGADGTVRMPQLPDPVAVAGKLPRELDVELEHLLVDKQFLVHPVVTSTILEYAAKSITVVGAVQKPGQLVIYSPLTLFDALARAGWTTDLAAGELTFKSADAAPARTISIDMIGRSADPALNPLLTGGEVVNVPDAPKVWVTGMVNHSGSIPVRRPGDASVLKLVADAQGLQQYYNKIAYIYRLDPAAAGGFHEIKVPLRDIMQHKAADQNLQAEDILLIPDDNGAKRRALLSMIQTLGTAATSTAVVTGMRP